MRHTLITLLMLVGLAAFAQTLTVADLPHDSGSGTGVRFFETYDGVRPLCESLESVSFSFTENAHGIAGQVKETVHGRTIGFKYSFITSRGCRTSYLLYDYEIDGVDADEWDLRHDDPLVVEALLLRSIEVIARVKGNWSAVDVGVAGLP